MSVKETNTSVVQGDTWDAVIYVTDSVGNPIDFSQGYTFFMEVRDKDGGHIVCATASVGDGITVIGLGTISVKLTPTKTKNFVLPKSKYQIISVDSFQNRKTLAQGWFDVEAGLIS